MRSLIKEKKGNVIGIIVFFSILLIVLIFGFIAAMAVGIIGFVSDEVTPIMEDLGMVGDVNVSEASTYTFGVADTFVNSLPWLIGFVYVAALIFSIIFAISYSYSPHPVFIGFYFMLVILLIFGSIIISNMYEEIYTGTDEVALGLQNQPLTSHMILYSPFILTVIALLTGVYLFTRPSEIGGGFGV